MINIGSSAFIICQFVQFLFQFLNETDNDGKYL